MLEEQKPTQISITIDVVNNDFKILNIPGNIKESNKIPYPKNLETTTDGQ